MDSVFPRVVRRADHLHRHQHRRPPPPCPADQVAQPSSSLVVSEDATPPPPPRQPIHHRCRRTETEPPAARPCPPAPAPPLPAREPFGPEDRRLPPNHHGSVETASTRVSVRPTSPTPALDSVIPLSHWPLRSLGSPHHPVALDKAPPSHQHHQQQHVVTLDDPVRRALPVNMLPVAAPATSSPLNHITPLPQAAVTSPAAAKPCPNGRGNVYVDSPTIGRNGTVVVAGRTPTQQSEGFTDWPRGGGGQLRPPPLTGPIAPSGPSPPTVKFNPVVQTNGGGTGALTGSSTSEKSGGVVVGQPRSSSESQRVCRGGIVCQRCELCRCANCTAPRELPRRWIGDFECSVQRCVGVSSCLCCVEALFYHCLDGADADDGGASGGAADDPCACCERPRCCLRWSLMVGLASTLLPCLCCYCPLQCGADALTTCYNKCASPRGCRCRTTAQEASSGSSTRGLLAESESSST